MKRIKLNKLSNDEILELKLKELDIKIEGSIIEKRIKRLYSELEEKGLIFKPHTWISDEWFTPDDTAGFALPFYLFHPRLMKLEKEEMFEAEGANKTECMQILRHETGHAVTHAYQLYRLRSWKKTFGSFNSPYPLWYTPEIRSKNYVTHLNAWYAQAHPLEDFAETFAVWLTPGINWKITYSGWPALNKLLYLDDLMNTIKERTPIINAREEYAPVKKLNYTLREHYQRKKKFYSIRWAESFDLELNKIFKSGKGKVKASDFIKKLKRGIRQSLADILDIPEYTIDQLISELIKRCIKLNLYLSTSEEEAKKRIIIITTAQIVNLIHTGYYRIPL